jgi:hypothetical protein
MDSDRELNRMRHFRGEASIIFPDGERVPITCELNHYWEFRNGVQVGERFVGAVNVLSIPGKYVNRAGVLEFEDARLSVCIGFDGSISPMPGVREGFKRDPQYEWMCDFFGIDE